MDVPEDDFQGFGDGFDGFPKRLPEDCVEYSLFVIDSQLKSPKEIVAKLEAVRKESLKLVGKLLKDYIWQRESFKLELETGNGRMYLHGLTNYGDSVEDEWLIVYMLKELSKQFPELWIKVVDTDGEFLLIEAANALPRWLNPEIADNRVWLHDNKLLIVPLTAATAASTATKSGPISRSLAPDESLQLIASSPDILINSPFIEEEAFYRLRNYPTQISASLHHAMTRIPRKLAYILHDRPASIAPAVEAFYLRDPVALKALSGNVGLAFPPNDLVTVSTRFTKVLYAQVKSQEFAPPPAWKTILSEAEKTSAAGGTAAKTHAQIELGMMVTSSFEMLVKDPKNSDNRTVRELQILLDDLEADPSLVLPTDAEILKWKDVARADDESWMDINFEDFERELQGKSNGNSKNGGTPGAFGPDVASGFGDAKTHGDLKKMVERFEAFLNDENAGPDGVEMDDMDFDNDEEEDEDDSEDEDKDISFDEKEFARMMREMMGMPSEEDAEVDKSSTAAKPANARSDKQIEEVGTSDEESDDDEESKMREVMERMEAELNEAGVLNLDPTPSKISALKGTEKSKASDAEDDSDEEESDGEVNIDFNLAKNLLESFKSQSGMAGPGGNMLSMMGVQLPRDEDDVGVSSKKS